MAKEKVLEVVRRLPLSKKKCPQCQKEFWGQSARKFCSTGCRNRAAYWRNPDAYRKARIESYRKQKNVSQ
ncbi:MAG: hypothetical protein ACRERD_33680 [Candidatus Binatia bacterium]